MLSELECKRKEAMKDFDIKKWKKDNANRLSDVNIGSVGYEGTTLAEAIKTVLNKNESKY